MRINLTREDRMHRAHALRARIPQPRFLNLNLGLLASLIVCGLAGAGSSRAAGAAARVLEAGGIRSLGSGEAVPPPRIEVMRTSDTSLRVEFELPALAVEEITAGGGGFVQLDIPGGAQSGADGEPMLPVFSRFLSIPDRSDVQISTSIIEEDEHEGVRLMPAQGVEGSAFVMDRSAYERSGYPETPAAAIAAPALMRGLRVVPLTFSPVRYDPARSRVRVARRLEVEVRFAGVNLVNERRGPVRPVPDTFDRLYRSFVLDYEGPRAGEGPVHGTWLLITPNDPAVTSRLQPLVDWRRRQGYPVYVATTAETGSTAQAIKNFIQDAYDHWDAPPEFIVLAGDAAGSFVIPTWHENVSGYGGEGDHPYTQLDGTDMISDAHVGRLSFGTLSELETIVAKTVGYESTPYLLEPDWFTRACLVGDPYDSGYSTVQVQQWIKIRLRQLGYTAVDTIFTGPFVSQMRTALNRGDTIFCYRGIYGFSGWTNYNTYQLTNTNKLFFSVTCTCGTGSFEQETSYSEAFLRYGTPSEPRAAVGAIGTATTGTHTRYNNCYTVGVWQGLLYENQWETGAAHTRGKFEMYANYQAAEPNAVVRYCYWNNLMGDPACRVWTATPSALTVSGPDSVPVGSTSVTVEVREEDGNPCEGAQVCLLKGAETFVVGTTGPDGRCELPVDVPTAGTMNLTVTKYNRRPVLADLPVTQEAVFVAWRSATVGDDGTGGSQGNGDGGANPGETIRWRVRLHNYGSEAAPGVTAALASSDPYLAIISGEAGFGDIAPGGEAEGEFLFSVRSDCPHGRAIRIGIDIASGEDRWHSLSELPVVSADLAPGAVTLYNNLNGVLDPGEVSQMSVRLDNGGGLDAQGTVARLISLSPSVYVTDADAAYGDLPAGGSGENGADRFTVGAVISAFRGELAWLQLVTTFNGGVTDTAYVSLTLGERADSDPIGPDRHGYYAFDDTDVNYPQHPHRQWIEIDPNQGGDGTQVPLGDYTDYQDKSVTVALPFRFRFYGQDFDQATICSNGWLAMGSTYLTDYRNWTIPGAETPSNLIAVFWDDLNETSTGHVYQKYDAANHRWIVEWSHLRNDWSAQAIETFEAVLYDPAWYPTTTGDGIILMQYEELHNVDSIDGFATAGIQNADHTDGLLYTFFNRYPAGAADLADGRAVLYLPGGVEVSGLAPPPVSSPRFALAPAAPNPAAGPATLRFSLAEDGPAELTVHDVAGRMMRRVLGGWQAAGAHVVIWDGLDEAGRAAPSGIYFFRLRSGGHEAVQRVVRF